MEFVIQNHIFEKVYYKKYASIKLFVLNFQQLSFVLDKLYF